MSDEPLLCDKCHSADVIVQLRHADDSDDAEYLCWTCGHVFLAPYDRRNDMLTKARLRRSWIKSFDAGGHDER